MSIDYRNNRGLFNFVPDGITRTQRQCANIEVIPDIEFEGTKSFKLFLDLIPTPRINVGPNATIVIIDYNGEHMLGILMSSQGIVLFSVIVQQQPESVCNGLENLINTTLPDNVTCSTFPDDSVDCIVECSTPEINLLLAPSPCNQSITITINGSTTLDKCLFSMPQPQALTSGEIELNVSVQVVYINAEEEYYILNMESSIGLNFPMTAVPLLTATGQVCTLASSPGCFPETAWYQLLRVQWNSEGTGY